MSNVYRMLTVTAWAAEMHISKQAGYLAVKRCGIPIVDGKVDADAATMLYRNRTRYRVNPKRMASAPPPPPPALPGRVHRAPVPNELDPYPEQRQREMQAAAVWRELASDGEGSAPD